LTKLNISRWEIECEGLGAEPKLRMANSIELKKKCLIALLQHHCNLIELILFKCVPTGQKEGGAREKFGKENGLKSLYDQLMVELRNKDQASFKNFLRMPHSMFHELLANVGP